MAGDNFRGMPIMVARPSRQALETLLDHVSGVSVTYPEQGATAGGDLPDHYRHDRYSVPLGHGDDVFDRGKEALRQWEGHRHARAILTPVEPPIVVGTGLMVTLRSGPVVAIAPCQIVYKTDRDDRFGFAYGTLPGHPERGEEAFHITRSAEALSFDIVPFFSPRRLPGSRRQSHVTPRPVTRDAGLPRGSPTFRGRRPIAAHMRSRVSPWPPQ